MKRDDYEIGEKVGNLNGLLTGISSELRQLREQNHLDHERVWTAIESTLAKLEGHDKRITALESLRKAAIAVGIAIAVIASITTWTLDTFAVAKNLLQ